MAPDLAKHLYPATIILAGADSERLPTLQQAWTKQGKEQFLTTHMNEHIQKIIRQPFGKPSLSHCFKTEATLRHVLAPVYRSGFLDVADMDTRHNLVHALPSLTAFFAVYDDVCDVDFNALRIPRRMDGPLETTIDPHRASMVTAALLFFDGNAATLVRWIGGLHTGAHRDTKACLAYLADKIDADTHSELTRLWMSGAPKFCNAESSERNFQAFFKYGNHSTVEEDLDC